MDATTQSAHRSAARAYGQVVVTSGVDTADAHGLVLMLYDGALEALARARLHLAAHRVAAKNQYAGQAVQIVQQGLDASLDRHAGGPLAGTLSDLYGYIARRILLASAGNDPAGFEEAARLLAELREAWAAIPKASRVPHSRP